MDDSGLPVQLRFLEPPDARHLYEAASESVSEVFPWLPWCHSGYQVAEAESWIASQVEARAAGTGYTFAILGSDSRLLGSCGLSQINAGHQFANVGYWVRSSATRRGVASEAVKVAARWAFETTALERLEIVAAVENHASQRAAEKAGAVREGIARRRLLLHGRLHDAVMYSLVRSDLSAA